MQPADLLLIIMLTALTLYAICGGADFGAGVWEFSTALQATDKERGHLYKAIGPVWEANHVWLIFVVVILFNGFPGVFAALSRALWLPLLIALAGIVFRGASFVFRSYGQGSSRVQKLWEGVFAVASTAAPMFLGASAGAVATGGKIVTAPGGSVTNYLTGWLTPLGVFTGFYAVGMCAYIAAVYLTREAHVAREKDLETIWRQRALSTGLWMGVLSFGGLAIVSSEAPELAEGFLRRGWPLVILSLVCGIGSLVETWRRNVNLAVIAASGAVASVLWGWGISQYPTIVPGISTADAKAPDAVLTAMLVVILTGAVLLFPALGYLMWLFKSSDAIEP
jgi:cytochrome d ubiquinol oxidase subunit II